MQDKPVAKRQASAERAQPQFGYSLNDMNMRLSRAFHLMKSSTRSVARSLGLGPGQPRVLSYIAVHGVSTQREIARFFVIDPSAVSRMLDQLEKNGFLAAVPGRDRRSRALDLTDKGRAAIEVWDRECARVDAVMLAGFSAEERQQLADLLDRLRANVSAEVARPADAVEVAGSTDADNSVVAADACGAACKAANPVAGEAVADE